MKESCANTFEGQVVSMTGNQLVTTCRDSKEQAFTVAADALVSRHKETCKAQDLKPGMKVRVTTKKDDKKLAIHIEALNKNETWAAKHESKVVSLTGNKLVTTCPEGKQHAYTLAADARVTESGAMRQVGDIKPGMMIEAITKKDDKNVVTRIELAQSV